jgi:predicted Zn-dependent protease
MPQSQRSSASDANRSRRQRYAINWRLFAISLGIIGVVLPATYLWYAHQLRRVSTALLARAESLKEAQDWTQATSYYQRYLLLAPEDTQALVHMLDAVAKQPPSSERHRQLTNLLFRTIGQVPERHDLRKMLAENLLQSGAFEDAEKEAKWLLKNAPEQGPAARKILALSLAARSRFDGAISATEVVDSLRSAAAEAPSDILLVETAANALREHPTSIEPGDNTAATIADQMMDQLVSSNPNDPNARLARYRYRVKYKLADADRDLKKALELDPTHVEALILSTRSLAADKPTAERNAEAEAVLRRVITLAPTDARGYILLASILEQSNKRDEALTLLERGRTAAGRGFEIGLAYANVQIGAQQFDAAERSVQDLESQSPVFLAQLSEDDRTEAQNRLQLTRARLQLAQGQSANAVATLEALLIVADAKPGHQQSPTWLDASKILAATYAQSGQWDKASERWGDVARSVPENTTVVQRAVDAYLRNHEPERAIALIDASAHVTEPNSELSVQRAQSHLMIQLSRTETERNWSEFEAALDAAKSATSDSPQLVICEATYLTAKLDNEGALSLLRNSEQKFKGQPEFWQYVAGKYQELGQPQDLQRALAMYREVAPTGVDHVVLEATLLSRGGKLQQADELLANVPLPISTEDQKQIERVRIEVLAASNDSSGAMRHANKLIEIDPRDQKSLAIAIDTALATGEFKIAETWESTLGALTNNGFDVRYLRARRQLLLLEQLTPAARESLQTAILQLRHERPNWYPVVSLSAEFAEKQSDMRQALSDYQLSVKLGDRRPATLERTITLLHQNGNFDDAQEYLAYLAANPDPFNNRLAVSLAEKQNRTVAIAMAKQSAERYPTDPMRCLTLANLLLRFNRPQEGLPILRDATRKFPGDSRVWLGLFSGLVQAGEREEARSTLEKLKQDRAVPPKQRSLILGQGYEIIGDLAQAKLQYKLAVEQDPNSALPRLKYGKLLRSLDPQEARAQYEWVIAHDPANGEARHELAALLAASNVEADWNRATELLAATSGESSRDASTRDRLRAMLLSKKGRSRTERTANCEVARKILLKLIAADSSRTADLNRILLARVLEQEAEISDDPSLLAAARNELRNVAIRQPLAADKLSLFIDFLLRHGSKKINPAKNLAAQNSDSDVAKLNEEFLAEAEAQLPTLQRLPSNGDEAYEADIVALQARLLGARGRDAEALASIAKFADLHTKENRTPTAQAQHFLVVGRLYSQVGAHAEAEVEYRRLMKINPSAYPLVVRSLLAQDKAQEAVQICLSVWREKPTPDTAALLANVLTTTNKPIAELPAAQAAIKSSLETHSSNTALLQAEAVRLISQGKNVEAATIFRKILAIEPNDVLTLNNLATTLAETPNECQEALDHIKRAIEIAGRQASLLDTQGTIYLKLGDAESAIACLEEATAGGSTDARFYLHLAVAYRNAHRIADADRVLTKLRSVGLERYVLTNDDRKMLATLTASTDAIAPTARTP